jgi:hypothetical protein
LSYICLDCDLDTTPCTGKRGCRHLERRIGRKLPFADFTDVPINDPDHPWNTRAGFDLGSFAGFAALKALELEME